MPPATQESAKAAPRPAAVRARKTEAAPRRSPNYATREETLKVAERVMEEDAEVFRRLADA